MAERLRMPIRPVDRLVPPDLLRRRDRWSAATVAPPSVIAGVHVSSAAHLPIDRLPAIALSRHSRARVQRRDRRHGP